MERHKAYAATYTPDAYASSGGVIVGLLLPMEKQGQTEMPPVPSDVNIWHADIERPLLLNHDVRQRVGTVRKIWRVDSGLAFLADVDAPVDTLPKGVSAGLLYYYTEGDEPRMTDIYIYEVSLTDTPAFLDAQVTGVVSVNSAPSEGIVSELFAKFVGDMEVQKHTEDTQEKMRGFVARTPRKSATLQAETDDLLALQEAFALLNERQSALEAKVAEQDALIAELRDRVSRLEDALTQQQGAINEAAEKAMAQLMASVGELDQSFANSLQTIFGTFRDLRKLIKQ